jgi:very-short-patch-repair endonuclease
VLEVDGKQHYAEGDTASPRLYSEMVSEDRKLRLRGYDVYRFGGHELTTTGAADLLREFFRELLTIYEAGP